MFFALLRRANRLFCIVIGANNGWSEDRRPGNIRASNSLFFLRFALKFSDFLNFSDQLHATELVVAHLLCVHHPGRCTGRQRCHDTGDCDPFKSLCHRLFHFFDRSELPY